MKISRDQYYAALGLFLVAAQKEAEVQSLVDEADRILGERDIISDAVWGDDRKSVEDFDKALADGRVTVETPEGAVK